MVIVGALVNVEKAKNATVQSALRHYDGALVQTYTDPTKIGFVFEVEEIKQAHDLLKDTIPAIDGVLSVSTVYANFEALQEFKGQAVKREA